MPNLDDVKRYLADETGLATISTTQADGRVLSSIVGPVDGGVLDQLGVITKGERVISFASTGDLPFCFGRQSKA